MKQLLGCLILINFLGILSCKSQSAAYPSLTKVPHLSVPTSHRLETVALGSCNKQYKEQPMWRYVLQNDPDLWLWLGDNIYADTENMREMDYEYRLQNANPEYQLLLDKCPTIGIWDDHDYGVNDGGKEYPKRKKSKKLFAQFMGYDKKHPIYQHEGVYHSYTFGPDNAQVKIILLDTRYFRDPLMMENSRYVPNKSGTLLGEQQWTWLEKELKDSKAQIHIIASSIQVISEQHRFEKWANFPNERERLFDLLRQYQVNNPLLLSGDRHAAEISRYPLSREQYVYDLTASGLTHAYTSGGVEPNAYRVGNNRVRTLNFGLLRIDWEKQELEIEIRGLENKILDSHTIPLNLP